MSTDNMPPHTTLAEPIRKYAEWYARAYAEQQTAELRAEVERLRDADVPAGDPKQPMPKDAE